VITQITPDATGEMTHDAMIPPRPPSNFQFRHWPPCPASVMPTVPPMMACVVETGIAVKDAIIRKMPAAASAPNMPTM